ncbi:hypothetical protein [Couchioplanes azureus]|uniref:hypothetical protein n=1 Tax=Couchioplanes caeruleus TaxID=56438 RepID=UPI00166F8FB2|nr:hypothetical protein [Couchioplanes caeruleus]GGQ77706.1 hypothetical protein GCM10010166_54590 [Couchioplanes caeruleus subsp. azureus]
MIASVQVGLVIYRCPGVGSYGHGLTEVSIHLGTCCQRFAGLPLDDQKAAGWRFPAPEGFQDADGLGSGV